MSLHNEQPPIQRPELVEPPTNEINGQPVIYEQNTEPGCNWPGGNFQARVEGSAPSFGNSYAEAYRSLEQRLSGIDQVPPARSPRRPPVAAQPETDDDAQTARSEQQPAFSGTQGVLTAEDLEQQPVDDALEAPVVEAPVAEAPVAEAPVAEAPVAEAPVADAPVADAPVAEAPVVEAPVAEAPVVEAPVAVTETPAAENQTATFIA